MKPASFWDWLGPIILMSMLITYLFLSTPSEIVLCRGNENCFRDWLGTLSTVAAFVAAATGSYFVYGQLEAQRKQTDFILGNGDPTLEHIQRSRTNHSGTFRLVNWNRKMLVVSGLTIIADGPFEAPVGVRRLRSKSTEDIAADFVLPTRKRPGAMVRLPGWIHRQDTPYVLSFLLLFDGRKLSPDHPIDKDIPATLELEVFYAGSAGSPFKLSVKGNLNDLLPTAEERGQFYFPIPRPK